MGIGDIITGLPAAGSPTAPTKRIEFGSFTANGGFSSGFSTGFDRLSGGASDEEKGRFIRSGPVWIEDLPAMGGVLMCDGWSPVRHYVEDNLLRTGILAPGSMPEPAPTGVKATMTITIAGYVSGDTGTFHIGKRRNDDSYFRVVPALDATLDVHQVLGNVSDNQTMAERIKAFLNDEAGYGTTYINNWRLQGQSYSIADRMGIVASSALGGVVTIEATEYGAVGNTYATNKIADSANRFTLSAWSLGAAGTGTAPEEGRYKYGMAYYRPADEAQSAISAYLPEIQLTEAMNVLLTLLAATGSEDSLANVHRIFRTLQEGGVFFRVGDQTGFGQFTDDKLDSDLVELGALPYDEAVYRPRSSGHVPRFRYVVEHLGGLWGIGHIPRSEINVGTVTVTADSTQVLVESLPIKKDDLEGMTFKYATHDEEYLVVRAYDSPFGSTTRPALELHKAYQGTTASGGEFWLRDKNDPHLLHFTEPLLYNNWPPQFSLAGVKSQSAEGGTGLLSMWESLIIWTRDGIWRLTGSSIESFQLRRVVSGSGCVSGHSVVVADGVVYWLGPEGFWAWAGDGPPVLISKPRVGPGGEVTGCQGTVDRINQECWDVVQGRVDPNEKILRWTIPLDDAYCPNALLVYDLRTGTWSLDKIAENPCEANVPDRAGANVVLLGDAQGNVWQADSGYTDGAFGFEPVATITTGSTVRKIELSGSPALPTTDVGLSGVPGLWINAAGDIEAFVIQTNDANTIWTVHPLSSAPVSGGKVVIGAIDMLIESGRFDMGVSDVAKGVSDFWVHFVPGTDGYLYAAFGGDQTAVALPAYGEQVADLTETDGGTRFSAYHRVNDGFKFQLRVFEPDTDVILRRVAFNVRSASKARIAR